MVQHAYMSWRWLYGDHLPLKTLLCSRNQRCQCANPRGVVTRVRVRLHVHMFMLTSVRTALLQQRRRHSHPRPLNVPCGKRVSFRTGHMRKQPAKNQAGMALSSRLVRSCGRILETSDLRCEAQERPLRLSGGVCQVIPRSNAGFLCRFLRHKSSLWRYGCATLFRTIPAAMKVHQHICVVGGHSVAKLEADVQEKRGFLWSVRGRSTAGLHLVAGLARIAVARRVCRFVLAPGRNRMVYVSMRLQACSCHLHNDVHVVQLFHSINALCEFSVSAAPQNIAKGSATSTVVLAHLLGVPPMQCEVAIPHCSPQRPSTIFHK